MNDAPLLGEQSAVPARKTRTAHYAVLGAVCALVIGVYAWSAKSGWVELWSLNVQSTYYNLLVQGFHAGQLNLKREVPSGLASLSDPYDSQATNPYLAVHYPLLDQSYYKGKLYLYFGVTPALVLFWPYAVSTGHYLLHRDAVVIFFSLGFLASAGLLWGVWRRYCAEVSVGVVAGCVLAVGLTNLALAILQRCDVYEVAISCGYVLTMVTLLLLWQALHAGRGQGWWLAGASLTYGLAVGARPSLLLGAVILLMPVAKAWREGAETGLRGPVWSLLLAATGPILCVGLGLMLYNFLRFGHPLEFGQRYQLSTDRQSAIQQFSLRYLWFNFRVGFLEPARWGGHFPFVRDIVLPRLAKGGAVEQLPFGGLTNIPLVWLAVAAPLAWRCRLGAERSPLRWLMAAVALLFGTGALTILLHNSMTLRYQAEFLPALVLLAVLGILGFERALAGRSVLRHATRCGWGLLLTFSVLFNVFAMFERSAETYILLGRLFAQKGQPGEAIGYFDKALQLQPDNPQAHCDLGSALFRQGKLPEAIDRFEYSLRLAPDFADAHMNLGAALLHQGKVAEALAHMDRALRLKPDFAEGHGKLGLALLQLGRVSEATAHLEQVVRLMPEYDEAHNNLGVALFRQGKVLEAIGQMEQALRLDPEYADAHHNLAKMLMLLGRVSDGIQEYEQMLRLGPENAEVQRELAWALATCGDGAVRNGARAVELAEGANQAAGGKDPAILDTLAAAYAEAGRFGEAVQTAQVALNLAKGVGQGEQARQIQGRLELYQARQPYHEGTSAGQPP